MAVLQHPGSTAANLGADRGDVALDVRVRHRVSVVTIHGVIDASNADFVREYAGRFAEHGHALIVDMTGVELIGAQGLSMLGAVNDQCRSAGVRWLLVSSPWVGHLLRAADGQFPTVDSVDEALHRFRDAAHVSLVNRMLLNY